VHKEQQEIGRREFFKTLGLGMTGLLMAGCDPRISPAEGKLAFAPLKSVDRFHHERFLVYDVFYRGDTERIAAYLTIDDGNSPKEMERALDIAKDYDIRLTLFPTGEEVDKNPAIYERAISEGHSIQNHTYSHPDFITERYSQRQIFQEIETQQHAVQRIAGDDYEQQFFRPPYGQYDEKVIKIAREEFGMKIAMWTTDSQGYNTPFAKDAGRIDHMVYLSVTPGSYPLWYPDIDKETLTRIKKTVDNPYNTVNGTIVLQHALPSDMRALPRIIEVMQNKGQKLITMPEGLK
jgi:peptidoglycan/xylan/chitin deacetylase (PgdA/CDA1 family)